MASLSEKIDAVPSFAPTRTNLLLKQLPQSERMLLERHLQVEKVAAGTILADVGDYLDAIYFPVDAVISLEQAARVELAMVGREGMFGWTAIASYLPSPFRAVVRGRDGVVLKMPLEAASSAIAGSAHLRAMLSQYSVIIAIHMGETIAAHSLHRLDARIARWLLVRHDRVGGDEIRAQHDEIADSLGARRASITDCLHIIEGEGHIRCRRGRITIRNRAELEAMASGCYGAAEAQYRSSFGSFAKLSGAT